MQQLNEFQTMWMSYPDESLALEKAFRGNSNSQNSVYNTCCIRLCYALNHTVSHKVYQSDIRATGLTNREYVIGENGKYIFDVQNMSKYLKDKYGMSTKKWEGISNQSREDFAKEIENKQGIILFHEHISSLSGHVDLWEKGKAKTNSLFYSAHSIEFWEVSN